MQKRRKMNRRAIKILLFCSIIAIVCSLAATISAVLTDDFSAPQILPATYMTTTLLVLAISLQSRNKKIFGFKLISRNKEKRGDKNMALPEMIKDMIGKEVLVVTLPDRNVGKLTEVSEEWIKLTRTSKKGVTTTVVLKIDMITSISEI